MSLISIDQNALSNLSASISKALSKTQSNNDTVYRLATKILRQVNDEVAKRQVELQQAEDALNACSEETDHSNYMRKYKRKQEEYNNSLKAQSIVEHAINIYKLKERRSTALLRDFSFAGKNTLRKLDDNLSDYTSFSGLIPASLVGALSERSQINNDDEEPLTQTKQTFTTKHLDGLDVIVFDHPHESAKNAVFNQGSTNPDIQGTCGICSAASIIKKSGKDASESSVLAYALSTGTCSTGHTESAHNGGTTATEIASIISALSGHTAHSTYKSMDQLASDVEKGKGVVIAVEATLLDPNRYGPYNPNAASGHALVLESVVRKQKGGEIVGFYVIDSNGTTPSDACRYYNKATLTNAYNAFGFQCVVTDGIIW